MQTQNIQLSEILDTIEEMGDLSESAMEAARARQEVLAKPTGALGRLEDISIQLAGITGKVKNNMQKQAIVIMSADNGIVSEGVASAPQSVTLSQTINFTRHLTGVSSMAKYFGIDLLVIDVGVKMPIPEALYAPEMTEHVCADVCCQTGLTQKIVNRRIADGTKNLAKEPAMTEDEALRAIRTGMEAVEAIKRCGYDIFGVGEMGIGNTTTSACVLAALCGRSGAEVVGRGGGLNDEGLAKKSALWTKPRGDLIPLMSSAFLPRSAALTSARWSVPSSGRPITSFRQSSTATSPLSRHWQRFGSRQKQPVICSDPISPRNRAISSPWTRSTSARSLTSACGWARAVAVRSALKSSKPPARR